MVLISLYIVNMATETGLYSDTNVFGYRTHSFGLRLGFCQCERTVMVQLQSLCRVQVIALVTKMHLE